MTSETTTIFLAGDVMTGRGVDQILGAPVDPELHEPWVRDARDYVTLVERARGAVPRGVPGSYPWGELLAELDRAAPALRVVNLETSVTARGEPWPDKAVRYRMSPANAEVLRAARIDVCTLANNHVLDYGHVGLADTLATLRAEGIVVVGAGEDDAVAACPARVPLAGGGHAVVLAVGCEGSGIPPAWAAGARRAGVDLLPDLSARSIAAPAIEALCDRVRAVDRAGDVVIVSIHWGSNWGDEVEPAHVELAHRLVDAGADVVHGHSSHHPRPIEVYGGRAVLYGCGDLINDYEGIGGHEAFRPELVLGYLVTLERVSGALLGLTMIPLELRRMRLEHARAADAAWLAARLDASSARFGTRIATGDQGRLVVRWG